MFHPPRLYAILDVDLAVSRGLVPGEVFAAWLDAGVRLIQLRAKTMPSGAMLELAARLAASARAAGADFIVNDRADVARLSGATGVHVGQTDSTPADVRRVIGADRIVGLSTHTASQVEEALLEPISYVAIGPVFVTSTKGAEQSPAVGLAGVREAARLAASKGLPLVAIGGITLARAPDVLAAGAVSVAVIADLLSAGIGGRAQEYLNALG